MSSPVYDQPIDCLAPGDVRELKSQAGFFSLDSAVVPASQDFTAAGAVIPGAPTSPLQFFVPALNDATVVATPGVGLQINPVPQAFTKTVNQAGVLSPGGVPLNNPTFDHVKYLVYGPPVDAPDDGREIGYVAEAAALQTYAATAYPAAFIPHIKNLQRDLRLCSFALNCIDPDNLNVFDTFFTNDTIYAFYEKLPFKKPSYGGPGPDYNAYSACIPIGRRDVSNPLGDFAAVQFAYNRKKGYVRWLINGVEKHRINLIGAPPESRYRILDHGGPVEYQPPTRLQFGFGLFSLLDMTRPLDPDVDPGTAATNLPLVALWSVSPNPPLVTPQPASVYYDPIRVQQTNVAATAGAPIPLTASDFVDATSALGNRLFGQGAQAVIKTWSTYVL